jgi:hypothetical protein
MRVFWSKTALFGPKTGQNQGFDVTDSSTGENCKLLIILYLQIVERLKNAYFV